MGVLCEQHCWGSRQRLSVVMSLVRLLFCVFFDSSLLVLVFSSSSSSSSSFSSSCLVALVFVVSFPDQVFAFVLLS